MNLMIVESPAKCSKIQGFLGPGWRVIATMGHIRALEHSLSAIGLDDDFKPKYEFIGSKAKTLKQLKESAAAAKQIYLASDGDREGHSIAYAVALLLKLPIDTTPRVIFHEITEKAIKAAVANPTTLDMNQVNAQQARAMLDLMIGFTMSPLLWRHVAPSISAGRCQTPALRLVVEREDQIRGFTSSSSWKITGQWQTPGLVFDAHLTDELDAEDSAQAYLEIRKENKGGVVISNAVKPWTLNAPLPLITSTLQQQASALYGMSPKNTMSSAQRLYEAGYITYMRTDKAVLSEDATREAKEWVAATYGTEYVSTASAASAAAAASRSKKKTATAGAGAAPTPAAQEAHEAIRPTHIETVEPAGELSSYDKKIYTLIRNRTLQSVMAPAKGETCTVTFTADGDDAEMEFTWQAVWKRTTFLGWQRIGKVVNVDANAEGDDEDDAATTSASLSASAWTAATSLEKDTKISWKSITATPSETKAPPRYTEATLVKELETNGIGRPSTFASLLATIQERGYVEIKDIPGKEVEFNQYTLVLSGDITTKHVKKTVGQEKKKLVPTDLGRLSLQFLEKHFADIFDYKFTARMEQRLDNIASGEEPWKGVLKDTWSSYRDRYNTLLADKATIKESRSEKIKEFGDGLKAVISKKGPLILIEKPKLTDAAPTNEVITAEGGRKKGGKKAAKEKAAADVEFLGWPAGVAFSDLTEEMAREFAAKYAAEKVAATKGEWMGKPIILRTGRYGPYVQVGDLNVAIKGTDTTEQILAKIEAKANPSAAVATVVPSAGAGAGAGTGTETVDGEAPAVPAASGLIRKLKNFEIRNGPYGPYMFKSSDKTKQFVSVPKGIKIDELTNDDVEALYKSGLEAKKRAARWRKK